MVKWWPSPPPSRRRRMASIVSLASLLSLFLFILPRDVDAQQQNSTNSSLPVYNIGVLFPDPAAVRAQDPTLNDMIVASEVAIQMASNHIVKSNILPDVRINFTRFISDENNLGQTAWTTVDMVESGVNAVIGDMVSAMTQTEAGITGVKQIPQCSCASASLNLSDKTLYPYFFRTVGNVVLFGISLVDWVVHMGWSMFALVYTDDSVGQQVLSAMAARAESHGIHVMTQIPLYDMNRLEDSLEQLALSGARIVIFADSNTSDQLKVLQTAMSMGLLSEGWVWMLTNDMSPAIRDMVHSPEELAAYDGLMFISGLWNLTGIPAYDEMQKAWTQQEIPADFTTPSAWNSSGLAYNAPNAFACAELLALGLNKALNEYPGGRQKGLSDLASGSFNASNMTPTFYNLNYTGPAGYMNFSETGDLMTGYFNLQYMLNGQVVTYATLKGGDFEFVDNTTVLYLGHTTTKPADMVDKQALNPDPSSVAGILVSAISGLGLFCCITMMLLVVLYRDLKPIMVSSPTFCCIQLTGLMLSYIGAFLFLGRPNPAKCIARDFVISGAFVFVVGSIIAKNYRIYRIFQNVFTVRTSRLRSMYLMRIVAVFGIIIYIPFIVWHSIHPVAIIQVMVDPNNFCWLCVYPGADGDWGHVNASQITVLILCAILMLVAAVLAFRTRKVRGKWAETNQVAYVTYNIGLAVCLASPGFFLPIQQYLISTYLKLSALLFGATFTLVVLFMPKFSVIMQYVYVQHRKHFWRMGDPRYRERSNSRDEFSRTGMSFVDYSDSSQAVNENLAARNLLDFSVQAHEGVLPVKKGSRFNYFSIWELHHVVVVPLKRFFILMNQSGHSARRYYYLTCEPECATANRYIFRVRTDDERIFLFQVHDQVALQRWLQWFRGPVDSVLENNSRVEAPANDLVTISQRAISQNDPYVAPIQDPMMTFGAVRTHVSNATSRPTSNQRSTTTNYLDNDTEMTFDRPTFPSDTVNDSSDRLLPYHHRSTSDHWLSSSPSYQQMPLSLTPPGSFASSVVSDAYQPQHY